MLVAASLELKAEKQSAHDAEVRSVAFPPDGKTIVSSSDNYKKGSVDSYMIKIWDTGVLAQARVPVRGSF